MEPELEAHGVSSRVKNGGEEHALLVDWDDYEPGEQVEDRLNNLEGLSVLTESSSGSKHVWNLTLRGRSETLKKLTLLKSDPMRTMMGYNWRPARWVTRVGPKEYSESGEVETPPPELITIQWNPTSRDQSKGHWDILASFVNGMPEKVPFELNWADTSPRVEKYRALSPEQKDG